MMKTASFTLMTHGDTDAMAQGPVREYCYISIDCRGGRYWEGGKHQQPHWVDGTAYLSSNADIQPML